MFYNDLNVFMFIFFVIYSCVVNHNIFDVFTMYEDNVNIQTYSSMYFHTITAHVLADVNGN